MWQLELEVFNTLPRVTFVEKVFRFLAAASLSGGLLVFSGLQQASALPAETSSNAADAESSSARFVSPGSTLSKIDEAKLESFLDEVESETSFDLVMGSDNVVGGSPSSSPTPWMTFILIQKTDAYGKTRVISVWRVGHCPTVGFDRRALRCRLWWPCTKNRSRRSARR